MRRRPGLGAIQDHKTAKEKFKDKGSAIQDDLVDQLAKQLEDFRGNLKEFSTKHQNDIKRDPAFREHFQNMCATIGVDPLASSKGFWSELLGMGEFYYELAVKVIEIVLSNSHMNGGIMALGQIKDYINGYAKNPTTEISCNDILRAINTLETLGRSCGVVTAENGIIEDSLIFCVPEELSLDNTRVIQYAASSGSPVITLNEICLELGWEKSRAKSILDRLILEGIVWVDDVGGRSYWFPGLFFSIS